MRDNSINSIENVIEFVEKLEEKIYKLDVDTSILSEELQSREDANIELYRVKSRIMDIDVMFIKTRREDCSIDEGYSNYVLSFIDSTDIPIYIPPDLFWLEVRKEREGKRVVGIVQIYLTAPNPNKNLMDILEECKRFKPRFYSVCFHEGAHIELIGELDENSFKKLGELVKEYTSDSASHPQIVISKTLGYITKTFPLNIYSEVYAESVEILGIIHLLKKGRISIDDAKEIIKKKLHLYSTQTTALLSKRETVLKKEGNIKIINLGDLMEETIYLQHYNASYIIHSFLLRKLKGKRYRLIDKFEKNIDTIEELFEELMQYAKKKFLEELRK